METSHDFFFFLINGEIEINTVWEITIFRYVKAVEGRLIPKRNYYLEGENGLFSHGCCWFWNGKRFHEGKKGKEFAYIRLLPFSMLLVRMCWHVQWVCIGIREWVHTCKCGQTHAKGRHAKHTQTFILTLRQNKPHRRSKANNDNRLHSCV